jgi:3'-phosphoadenosine 5'-phosphosulfate sulfotransferase (PAPS reductase)/FAD synthetase
LAIWTDEDVWGYIEEYNVPYCEIYDLGYEHTGCAFCLFGIHKEKEPNRLQRMKSTHPKLWRYGLDALGLRQVCEYMGVAYE